MAATRPAHAAEQFSDEAVKELRCGLEDAGRAGWARRDPSLSPLRHARPYDFRGLVELRPAVTSLGTIFEIGERNAARLRQLRIMSGSELLAAAATPIRRELLAAQLRLEQPKRLLEEWGYAAELAVVTESLPAVNLLLRAGIRSAADLAREGKQATTLHARLDRVNVRDRLCRATPSVEVIEAWTRSVSGLAPRVEPDKAQPSDLKKTGEHK